MTTDHYAGRIYFIIPKESGGELHDTTVLGKINEIHSSQPVHYLMLKSNESFRASERYCFENNIGIIKVADNPDLVEEITRYYGADPRRFVFPSFSEDEESLKETLELLAGEGYYLEVIIPHYPF